MKGQTKKNQEDPVPPAHVPTETYAEHYTQRGQTGPSAPPASRCHLRSPKRQVNPHSSPGDKHKPGLDAYKDALRTSVQVEGLCFLKVGGE